MRKWKRTLNVMIITIKISINFRSALILFEVSRLWRKYISWEGRNFITAPKEVFKPLSLLTGAR